MHADAEPSSSPSMLATLAAARVTRMLTRAWWVSVGALAGWAYLDAAMTSGVGAPLAGAVFTAGMCVVAAVARNASAEARLPGSVRGGSVMRAAGFGAVTHGGLLGAVTVFGGNGFMTTLAVILGGLLVAFTRPVTLVALGADIPVPSSPHPPSRLSVPQIVRELRASAALVRDETDPVRKAELAERRGLLLADLVERDPEAMLLLLDDSGARPSVHEGREGPDGPIPA